MRKTYQAHQRLRFELEAMVAGFKGTIVQCPRGREFHEAKRAGSMLGPSTEGRAALRYGTPVRGVCRATAGEARLIKAR